jgi:hypothetical protein
VLVLLAVCSLALASRSHAQAPEYSVARRWTDLLLASIRRDFGRPTIHARNLFHVSVAMWDAWAAFDDRAHPWVSSERMWQPTARPPVARPSATLRTACC